MSNLISLLETIFPYSFDIFLIIMFSVYRKPLLFVPLAGGNGVIQMDELSKGIILVVFYLSARAESFRTTEYHVFSDAYWYALLGCVALIAGIKSGVFHKMAGGFKKEEKKEE